MEISVHCAKDAIQSARSCGVATLEFCNLTFFSVMEPVDGQFALSVIKVLQSIILVLYQHIWVK